MWSIPWVHLVWGVVAVVVILVVALVVVFIKALIEVSGEDYDEEDDW